MTDDLLELLRSERSLVCAKAASHIILQDARIEQLEARIEQLAATNEELEAKLAKCEARFMKAVDIAFEECPYWHGSGSYHDWWYNRRVAIEKLTEGIEDELGCTSQN